MQIMVKCDILVVQCGNEKNKPFANMLCQLITANGKYTVGNPITEKIYKKSYLTLGNKPKSHHIYFGDGKEISTQSKAICWKYDMFGMRFGWLGKRCVITANPNELIKSNIQEFIKYYNSEINGLKKGILDLKELDAEKNPYFGEEVKKNINNIAGVPVRFVENIPAPFAKVIAEHLGNGIKMIADAAGQVGGQLDKSELIQRQYELLIYEFFKSELGFEAFMNNRADNLNDSVVIVYDQKNEEYSHLLQSLLFQYKGHSVAEYEQKYYMDNAHSILASKCKVIFLGDSKAYKAHWVSNANTIYRKYGMQYERFVNLAFLNVVPLEKDKRKSFVEYYRKCHAHYDVIAKTYEENRGQKNEKLAMLVGVLEAPTLVRFGLPVLPEAAALYGVAVGVNKIAAHIKTISELKDYQYQLLIRDFVYKYYDKFMGE